MTPPHCLHVIPGLMPGGALRSLTACARACSRLTPLRHTVAGLSPCPDADLGRALAEHAGLEVVDAPDRDSLHALAAQADLVVVHFWNDPRLCDWLREDLPAMRLVIHCHVSGLHAPQAITPELVALADTLLLTSPVSEAVPALAGLDADQRRERVRVIPAAADFSRLEDLRPRPHSGFVVTYLGTVDFLKMHPDFMAMAAGVRLPQARFVVRGNGGDHDVLRRQAAALGLAGRCDIDGPTDDVRGLLATTDVFGYPLCPDNYATSELVLHEAAFAGLPAVVLPHGGAARTVLHDFTGYVVHDAVEYAKAIEHLFHHPEERARLGDNAREYVRQCFGAENAARKTVPVYRALLARPKRARLPLGASPMPLGVVERLLADTGPRGAWRFVESLAGAAPHFRTSLLAADDPETALAADAAIATETPLMVRNGLFPYRDAYPEDGTLHYWVALAQGAQGQTEDALAGCFRAVRLGCDHWRVFWAMARLALALEQHDVAREAVRRVLDAVPGLTAARELLDTLDAAAGHGEPSLDDMRLRRHLFTQAGDLDRAEDCARIVLKDSPDAGDFEAFYLLGVSLQRHGRLKRAQAVYARVLADARAPEPLQAWALFKQGEILLDAGQTDEARSCLAEALRRKPDLTKAAVLLAAPDKPLYLTIGDAPQTDTAIPLPMNPLDADLWDYYCARRRPDRIALAMPPDTGLRDWTRLGRLLFDHLAPNGEIRLRPPVAPEALAALTRAGFVLAGQDANTIRLQRAE